MKMGAYTLGIELLHCSVQFVILKVGKFWVHLALQLLSSI